MYHCKARLTSLLLCAEAQNESSRVESSRVNAKSEHDTTDLPALPLAHITSHPHRLRPPQHRSRYNSRTRLCGDSNLDFNTGLNVDDDLLDDLGGGVQVDQSLVDSHLVHVPGLGAFTARSFSGCDLVGMLVYTMEVESGNWEVGGKGVK